tara:strand:- start:22 stop:357 length:336 start_codon:yes stop_codon:yes gene_type:complete
MTFTELQKLELEIKEKRRVYRHWESKGNVAEQHMENNHKKINNLREKYSKMVYDSADDPSLVEHKPTWLRQEYGCDCCGLSCNDSSDLCVYCYRLAEGIKKGDYTEDYEDV